MEKFNCKSFVHVVISCAYFVWKNERFDMRKEFNRHRFFFFFFCRSPTSTSGAISINTDIFLKQISRHKAAKKSWIEKKNRGLVSKGFLFRTWRTILGWSIQIFPNVLILFFPPAYRYFVSFFGISSEDGDPWRWPKGSQSLGTRCANEKASHKDFWDC